MKEYGFNTTLLHGTEGNNPHGATQVPIYQSSAFCHGLQVCRSSLLNLRKSFQIKWLGILTQESTTRR